MLRLALDAVRLGTSVVVDYGCWSRDERSAIRRPAEGARFRMVYLPVDDETRRARVAHRWATAAEDVPDRRGGPPARARALRGAGRGGT